MKYYAVVRWLPGDIKTLRPGWTNKMCVKFLESKEQAAFIVRACNSHEALLKALKEIINIEWAQDPESRNVRDEHLKEYDRLIKKAEGKV